MLIGSALRSIGSVAVDSIQGHVTFDADHIGGRFAYKVIGSVGGIAGNLLMQDLISGLHVSPEVASALSIFSSGAGQTLEHKASPQNLFISAYAYNFYLRRAKAHAKNVNRELTTLRAGAFWFIQTLAA